MKTIFDETISFLKKMNAGIEFHSYEPISEKEIRNLLEGESITIPESFIKFYTEFSNGLELSWAYNEDLDDEEYGNIEIPSIEELIESYK